MTVTLCRFPRMRLPNQNVDYRKFEARLPQTGTEAALHQYTHNRKACFAVSSAIAFRSVIEHSKKRFNNLKPKSVLSALVDAFPPLVLADKAFEIDAFDVALMFFMCDEIKCIDDKDQPVDPATPSDHDITQGSGRALRSIQDFLPEAGAKADIFFVRVGSQANGTFNGKLTFPASFPTFDDKKLISLLDAGTAVMVIFDFYSVMRDATGNKVVDQNGKPVWKNVEVGHTVVINGYVKDSSKGTLFRVYDPFGVEQNTSEVTAGKIFVSASNGYFEYMRFKQLQKPTILVSPEETAADALAMSQFDSSTGYDHPLFLFNPFLTPNENVGEVARIVVGFGTIVLENDHSVPLCSQIPETELLGVNTTVKGLTVGAVTPRSQSRKPQIAPSGSAKLPSQPDKGPKPPSIRVPSKK